MTPGDVMTPVGTVNPTGWGQISSKRLAAGDRRSHQAVAELSRQLNAACVSAVQPQELAAILEAEGYTDALVQERFGLANVFECAERLFALVPFRATTLPRVLAVRPTPLWRDLLRGVLYFLPAIWTPAALDWSGQGLPAATGLGLLTATLFGWGWMQGMAGAGYLGLVFGPATAATVLRRVGLWAIGLTAALAAALAWITGAPATEAALVAAAMAVYLAAATILLVFSREALLAASLLPALGWALVQTVWSDSALSGGAVQWSDLWSGIQGSQNGLGSLGSAGLALAVAGPAVAAWSVTRPVRVVAGQRPPVRPLGGLGRVLVLPACYGWLCAAFLATILLQPGTDPTAATLAGVSWSAAPLVLSMGLLELTLRRLQTRLHQQAQSYGTVRQIVWQGMRQVLRLSLGFAALLGVFYAMVRGLAPVWNLTQPSWTLLGGHVGLGVALLLSGLLINFRLLPRVVFVWSVAVATQTGLVLTGHAPDISYALTACGALLALLLLTWLAVLDIRNLG